LGSVKINCRLSMSNVRACTICSGSSANAVYIEIDGEAVLIDAGCNIKRISSFLYEIGVFFRDIKAVFITHEHCDHIKCVSSLVRRKIPIIANRATLNNIKAFKPSIDDSFFREMPTGFTARNGNFTVTSFKTSHDCVESVGYVVKTDKGNIGVFTDLGVYDDNIVSAISGCKLVFIEANHDEEMLWNGRYPYPLKQRIAGNRGHLSNEQCGKLLAECGDGVKFAVLSHLSKENNTPEKALSDVSKYLSGNIILSVAPRREPSDFIIL